jgi:hypothetical protein
VFENRVLRKTFGPEKKEVTGDWRKLQNEELCELYFSQNILRMIKSRRLIRPGVGGVRGIWSVLRRKMYTRFRWVHLREETNRKKVAYMQE